MSKTIRPLGCSSPPKTWKACCGRLTNSTVQRSRPRKTGKTTHQVRGDRDDAKAWDDSTKWRNGGGLIEGMYNGRHKAIILLESQLGKYAGGNNLSVHEAGHAYEDAIQVLNPKLYD